MMDGPQHKRLRLSKVQLEEMTKEEIIDHWMKQDNYVDMLETRALDGQKDNSELVSLRESEEKMKQQQSEATRRENVLVMRLTTKEQEMQDYANQIQELKQAQVPGSAQLRSTLLDPAVNLMFERMKKELDLMKAKLEETQNDLSAWKFTPDSNTGKRLMAKCRLLHQENEELGKIISSGRVAKLEGDLALQRNFSEEMKKSQAELDEFLMELDEDVEGMQSTIYFLQQQLRESKELTTKLQQEIDCARVQTEASSKQPKGPLSEITCHTQAVDSPVLPEAAKDEDMATDSNILDLRTPDSIAEDSSSQNKRNSPTPQSDLNVRMNGDTNEQQLVSRFRTSSEESMDVVENNVSHVTLNNVSSLSSSEDSQKEVQRTTSPHSLDTPAVLSDACSPVTKADGASLVGSSDSEREIVPSQDNTVHEGSVEFIHSPHTPPDPPPKLESDHSEVISTISEKGSINPSVMDTASLKTAGNLEETDHNYDVRTEKSEVDSKQIATVNGLVDGNSTKVNDGEMDA